MSAQLDQRSGWLFPMAFSLARLSLTNLEVDLLQDMSVFDGLEEPWENSHTHTHTQTHTGVGNEIPVSTSSHWPLTTPVFFSVPIPPTPTLDICIQNSPSSRKQDFFPARKVQSDDSLGRHGGVAVGAWVNCFLVNWEL